MTSSTPHHRNASNPSEPSSKDPASSNKRSSFIASLLSISSSPTTQPPPRHNSLSSSTCSSSPSVSQSLSSIATHNDYGISGGSPASSIASPGAGKPNTSPTSPSFHQAGLSGSFSSLASSFRWPSSAGASNVQPISIPNSQPGSQINDDDASSSLTRSSAPTRHTSVGAPSFRRAFELPNYSNMYSVNDNPQDPRGPADPTRRGRSGSLFSSFGVGDATKRASGPPRRKLSPMGERMIRDHPF